MLEPPDTNASIWKSDAVVEGWVSETEERERTRLAQWRLMGELLPFSAEQEFTFLDLGAGTGSAAKAILDLYPQSTGVLADYSTQMIEQGGQALADFAGRFRYVSFDMLAEPWPGTIPDPVGRRCHVPVDLPPARRAQTDDLQGHLRPSVSRGLVPQLRPGRTG
jgi:SAM-dependent methyltransferase